MNSRTAAVGITTHFLQSPDANKKGQHFAYYFDDEGKFCRKHISMDSFSLALKNLEDLLDFVEDLENLDRLLLAHELVM